MDSLTNKIIIAVAGEDMIVDYADYGLTFNSTEKEFLEALRPAISERFNTDIYDASGISGWLYKVRKANDSRNIYLIPNSTAGSENKLSYLDDQERLAAYNAITEGCMHLWSKGKLQQDKYERVMQTFSYLAEKDPLFLAHFTSYAVKKMDSKDLKVVATFANSLSDADGTPFSLGSSLKKPNWRLVSQAAFVDLDPKSALRVLKLANTKMKFGSRSGGTHFSKTLKTAAKKYIRYREANPKALNGIKKSGLGNIFQDMYRLSRVAPSPEATQILRWKQKAGYPGAGVEKAKTMFDFSGMSDLDIANKIRTEKLPPLTVLGALPDKLTPVVAAAILEQATGDQAVILTEMFENQGLLKVAEVKAVYTEKVQTAKTAIDRVERIKSKMDQEVEEVLKEAKSNIRKEQVGDMGKIFLHLDVSGSMHQAIETAIDKGAIIAESVKDPHNNFHWGMFNSTGVILPTPTKFTKDGFAAVLYGQRAGGGTNCLALYKEARRLGCEIDVYITDQGHTDGHIPTLIQRFRSEGIADPKQVVIINVGSSFEKTLSNGLKDCGIPFVELKPTQLSESALVSQAIRTALRGVTAVIDEILATPLLHLPKWWGSIL